MAVNWISSFFLISRLWPNDKWSFLINCQHFIISPFYEFSFCVFLRNIKQFYQINVTLFFCGRDNEIFLWKTFFEQCHFTKYWYFQPKAPFLWFYIKFQFFEVSNFEQRHLGDEHLISRSFLVICFKSR